MFLRFAFCFISRHFCNWNGSITTANNAWGGFSLGLCVMECRKEAARMKVRNGVALNEERRRAVWENDGMEKRKKKRGELEEDIVFGFVGEGRRDG